MNTTDFQGVLVARLANLRAKQAQGREQLLMMEANVVTARRVVDETTGEIRATEQALADLASAVQGTERPLAPGGERSAS